MSCLLGGSDTNFEDRLSRLEQVLKKEEEQSSVGHPPLPVDISSVFAPQSSTLTLLTPSTKERTAKGFILAGKEQEQRGRLLNALALYENGN